MSPRPSGSSCKANINFAVLWLRRLLQQGAEEAAWVVSPGLPHISTFSEEQSPEVRDRIFEDFNSLAVVYRMPASSFGQVRAYRALNHRLQKLFSPLSEPEVSFNLSYVR